MSWNKRNKQKMLEAWEQEKPACDEYLKNNPDLIEGHYAIEIPCGYTRGTVFVARYLCKEQRWHSISWMEYRNGAGNPASDNYKHSPDMRVETITFDSQA
jgi:hypothetical protein